MSDTAPKLYPVHERFHTFQGEGEYAGRPAFFIRLFGCPVKCPWCDAAGTWHPKFVPPHIAKATGEMLATEAKRSGSEIVVITGGEPCIHDLEPLFLALHQEGLYSHIETCGAFAFDTMRADWITLSPKRQQPPIEEVTPSANEYKIIVERPEDIGEMTDMLLAAGADELMSCWLHPEWSQRQNPVVLRAICDAVKMRKPPLNYRAGWQMHKLFAVDQLDARSVPPVPLGGDPKRPQ